MRLSGRDRSVWLAGVAGLIFIFGAMLWLGLAAASGASVAGQSLAAAPGLGAAIAGTAGLLGLALLFSSPVALAAAIYLEELSPPAWLARLLSWNLTALAAVPSVVWGLAAVLVSGEMAAGHVSLWLGGLVLGAVMLPIELVVARDALRAVPRSAREAAWALGATQWQALWRVVVPATLPSLMTGLGLAVARAVGEAAPLLVLGAWLRGGLPVDPVRAYTSLPVLLYGELGDGAAEPGARGALVALLLMGAALGASSGAMIVRYRRQQRVSE